jgi:hypothetical protein
MGDINQLIFAKKLFSDFKGSVLEVGSKNYGNTQNFRQLIPSNNYTGIDLEDGENVDVVHNLENGLGPLKRKKFDLVIICSVLEHSPQPWILANSIQKLMNKDSILYSCHPFVWRYHKYPDDYFRFSPRGIQALFGKLPFWLPEVYSTIKQGEFLSFAKDNGIDNKLAKHDSDGRKYLPYLQTIMVGCSSEKISQNLREKIES